MSNSPASPSPPALPWARTNAFLFVIDSITTGVWLLWVFGVEREMFPRSVVAIPAVLLVLRMLYTYLGGRSWLEAPKSRSTWVKVSLAYVLLLGVVFIPTLPLVTGGYVFARAVCHLTRLTRLPDRLWSKRAQIAFGALYVLSIWPFANHVYMLHGVFFYLGKVHPPVMQENAFYGVNSGRYRDTLLPDEARPGSRRVLVAGDSVTFGFPFEPAGAYPQLVESILRDRGDQTTRVVNMGMPSQSLVQIAAKMDRYLALSPDTLLLMVGKHYEKSELHHRAIEGFEGPWLRLERERSPLPPFLPELAFFGFLTSYRGLYAEDLTLDETANVARYREALDGLLARAGREGLEVMLLEYPGLYYSESIDAVNAELAARHGVPIVPLRHLFSDESEYVFGDAIHPKREGMERMAVLIADALQSAPAAAARD